MENNYYQPQNNTFTPPVQPPQKEKKSFFGGSLDKQHIFMGVSILLGSYLIPWISSGIFNLISALISGSYDSYYGYDTSSVSWITLLSNISNVITTLLTLAVYILFAYLAYKKVAKAACFVGVAFVATKISGVVTGIFNTFFSIIGVIVAAIDSYAYYDYTEVVVIFGYIISFLGLVISVAAGIFLLMFVEKGKLNLKKKNKAAPVQPQNNSNYQI